jgi:metallo-beta-lactamase class B
MISAALLVLLAQVPSEWTRPIEPHRIAANVYYVGTEDLACFLITDPAGHVLINTGLAESNPQLVANIAQLGFRIEDVKLLLTNQAHYDHVAGFADLKKRSGAKVFATPPDAKLLESGGAMAPGDTTFSSFAPVKVDRILKDGETIRQGKIALKVHYHFGHTPGSASYEMNVDQDGRRQSLLFANMGTVVMPLDSPVYPAIVSDLRRTFERQAKLNPDIWVAAHRSQYPPGTNFQAAVEKHRARFEQQVKIQLGQ